MALCHGGPTDCAIPSMPVAVVVIVVVIFCIGLSNETNCTVLSLKRIHLCNSQPVRWLWWRVFF